MNQPEFDNLIDEVLRLPDVQRTILRDRINKTLDSSHDDLPDNDWKEAWLPELKQRILESDQNIPGIPAEQVFEKLRAQRYDSES